MSSETLPTLQDFSNITKVQFCNYLCWFLQYLMYNSCGLGVFNSFSLAKIPSLAQCSMSCVNSSWHRHIHVCLQWHNKGQASVPLLSKRNTYKNILPSPQLQSLIDFWYFFFKYSVNHQYNIASHTFEMKQNSLIDEWLYIPKQVQRQTDKCLLNMFSNPKRGTPSRPVLLFSNIYHYYNKFPF